MQKRSNEFGYYFVIGGVATLIDWGTYAVCFKLLGFQYLIALVCSMGLAGCFHYIANKRVTFQCQSRQYGAQVPLYIFVALLGLAMSMGLMMVMVRVIGIPPIFANVIKTVLMLLPNYFMHKHITFSSKLFGRSL